MVVEAGYRNELTAGPAGTSALTSYPMDLLRLGIDKHDELILEPPNMALRSSGIDGLFSPAVGTQDSGFGWKHSLQSHAWYQDAVEVFVNVASGTHGYSAGAPTYAFTYIGAFSLTSRLSVNASVSLTNLPGTTAQGQTRRYASYSPSLTLSYALDPNTSLLVNDNVAFPIDPAGGSSNVILFALQRALSPGVVLDVESEHNLTPAGGYRQHAIGFGGAFAI